MPLEPEAGTGATPKFVTKSAAQLLPLLQQCLHLMIFEVSKALTISLQCMPSSTHSSTAE